MTNEKKHSNYKAKHQKIEILFEDEYICVINKPSGLLSVPSASKEKSALTILEEIMRKKGTFSPRHKPFAVHRLDRDTSGVMMFALSENAQKKLMDSWHKTVTERLYRALAENPKNSRKILPDSGLIDDDMSFNAYNIGFVPSKNTENKTAAKTVAARTHFTVILRGKTHTLFELSLDTGKKNQIRAHLASKGYTLAGDKNFRAKTNYFSRLCLHARTLEFTHPFTGKKMRFEVKEPSEWAEYVQKGDFYSEKTKKAEKILKVPRRLSAKEKAHMNFIEQGKAR